MNIVKKHCRRTGPSSFCLVLALQALFHDASIRTISMIRATNKYTSESEDRPGLLSRQVRHHMIKIPGEVHKDDLSSTSDRGYRKGVQQCSSVLSVYQKRGFHEGSIHLIAVPTPCVPVLHGTQTVRIRAIFQCSARRIAMTVSWHEFKKKLPSSVLFPLFNGSAWTIGGRC